MLYSEPDHTVLEELEKRDDPVAVRIRRLLGKPDLTRQEGSPVRYTVDAITAKPRCLRGHDLVAFPEVVPVKKNFDLLGVPADHPSRAASDTYYVDENHVLRTQTTTMWPYYLRDSAVRERLHTRGSVLALSYGKVYRNDRLDRSHSPVFHQIDGLRLCRREIETFGVEHLVDVLVEIAEAVYGSGVEWRVEEDSFPFTEPSVELQIRWHGEWMEVLGAGLVRGQVLSVLDISPEHYNGWAFGFGLDRLAMIKMNIPDIRILWSDDERIRRQFTSLDSTYRPVSFYPPTDRDISLVLDQGQSLNAVYELIRECGNDLAEEVDLIDSYTNEKKFGSGRTSYTFRIRYRSHTRTLTHAEVNALQEEVRRSVVTDLGATLR